MKKKLVTISAFMVLITSVCVAQQKTNTLDEVVISDTKFAQSKEKSGKVIEKISQQDLQKKSGQSVATVLNAVVGVEINGSNSANGKNLGYYIRGGKNQQVLILIDGNSVTDASGIGFEYDLRLLPVDQIESIEIMKGAASTLYGTGAATAVINVTLKKSEKKPFQANGYFNIGTNATSQNQKFSVVDFNQGFSATGTLNRTTYLASINSTETNGMSQIASPNKAVVYESDAFSRQNYITKLGFAATKKLQLDFFGNYDYMKNDYDFVYDNTGFNDTDKNKSKTKQFRVGFLPKYVYKNGEIKLNSNFTNIERHYEELNLWTNSIEKTKYFSRNINLDLVNKTQINKQLAFILGTNYQFYDMANQSPYGEIRKEKTKFSLLDFYTALIYNSNFGLNINLGTRYNNHSQYGDQWVYNINPSFLISKNVKLISSYSTAFITPSLYQLYSPYGNTSLTPEKNSTVEAGFEIQIDKLNLSTVIFLREQKNAIGFDATYHYANISGNNQATGFESSLKYQLNSKITFAGNYTFTQVDQALNRLIPEFKANANVDFMASKRLLLSTNYQYTDGRQDAFFDGNTFAVVNTKLGSYQLWNATAKYELVPNKISIFGNISNILNENFVENIGYSTRGRNFKIGLTFSL